MRKIVIIIALVGLVGCYTRVGPNFNVNTMVPAPDDAVIVYFYFPRRFPPARNFRFPVIANNVKIGALANGGYFKQVMLPGDYKVHSDVATIIDRVAIFTFEAGKTYFVKFFIERGMWASSIRFTVVHKDDAIPEIKKTGLQGESKHSSPKNTVDSFDEGVDEYYAPQDSEN